MLDPLPEPPVADRRGAPPSDEPYAPALCHPSLAPDHRHLPFPATGREEVPYFAGYLGAISVANGEPLTAHVATRSAERCAVDVYRVVGCEDASLRPQLAFMRRLGPVEPLRLPPSAAGRRLSSGEADSRGSRWPGHELLGSVPDDWPSGVYLAQFTSADEPRGRTTTRGGEDALFIVRSAAGRAGSQLLCQVNVATWAAYHMWHNRSLYMGRTAEGRRYDELRAFTASLQRPGLGLGLPNETILTPAPPKATYVFAFIDWLEREGLAVDFCSGLDVSAGRAGLDRYRALITVGHDEYWTASQHEAVQAFRAGGGHTVFLGGNLAHWQVRATDDLTSIECHKSSSGPRDDEHGDGGEPLDPLVGHAPAPGRPLTGESWRVRDGGSIPTTGAYNVVRRPAGPQELLSAGAMWWWEEVGGPARPACGFSVCEPGHWAFAGLGLQAGETFGAQTKLIGHEADGLEIELRDGTPQLTFADGALPGTELLAVADCRRWAEWDFGGWPPIRTPGQRSSPAALGGFATVIHRRAPGEGMLFCAATTEWVFGLLESLDWTATRALEAPVLPVDEAVGGITRNVLRACLER